MTMLLVSYIDQFLLILRPAVFVATAIAAVFALLSYLIRTRKIAPFSPIATFVRKSIDPWFVAPMERRVLRAGGTPYAAPWWALVAVGVGGLVLLSAIGFIRDQIVAVAVAQSSGSRGILFLLVQWTFGILRLALFARVISSWVGGSPYSKWWRWSYALTEPILAPLRRVVPTIGMIDITVIVAYFGLGLLQGLVLGAI